MNQKQYPVELMSNLNSKTDIMSNNNHSQEYLKRMVEVKDRNIEDLLKELRETKQIYHQYKTQYFNQQKRIKAKLTQITAKLDVQNGEIDRYKQISGKLKIQLETSIEKEKKISQAHEKQVRQLKNSLVQAQARNKELTIEKGIMQEKQIILEQKCSKLEQRFKNKTAQTRIYEQQARSLREELLRKEEQWRAEKMVLFEKAHQQQKKKVVRDRTNTRLDALENKIKSTLMKI